MQDKQSVFVKHLVNNELTAAKALLRTITDQTLIILDPNALDTPEKISILKEIPKESYGLWVPGQLCDSKNLMACLKASVPDHITYLTFDSLPLQTPTIANLCQGIPAGVSLLKCNFYYEQEDHTPTDLIRQFGSLPDHVKKLDPGIIFSSEENTAKEQMRALSALSKGVDTLHLNSSFTHSAACRTHLKDCLPETVTCLDLSHNPGACSWLEDVPFPQNITSVILNNVGIRTPKTEQSLLTFVENHPNIQNVALDFHGRMGLGNYISDKTKGALAEMLYQRNGGLEASTALKIIAENIAVPAGSHAKTLIDKAQQAISPAAIKNKDVGDESFRMK